MRNVRRERDKEKDFINKPRKECLKSKPNET
jgi:hypothetical protein